MKAPARNALADPGWRDLVHDGRRRLGLFQRAFKLFRRGFCFFLAHPIRC